MSSIEKNRYPWNRDHEAAMRDPFGSERTVVDIIKMLHRHRDRVDDYYYCDHWIAMLKVARASLNYEHGRLDAARCDRVLCDLAAEAGYDLDLDRWDRARFPEARDCDDFAV